LNIQDRLSRLRHELKRKNIGAMLVAQPENRYYLSGFSGSDGYLFISQREAILATDFRYVELVKRESPDYRLVQIKQGVNWLDEIAGRTKRLGFEEGFVTVAQHSQLAESLKKARPHLEMVPISAVVEKLRVIKDPAEIGLISRAADLTRKAFEYAYKTVEAGMTELRLAWLVESFLRENGSQAMPFEVIAASGPSAALPHARPSERQIQAGEPITIDVGAKLEYYCADMTRTFCLGEPDETYRKVYDTVKRAQEAGINAVCENATGGEVDRAARKVIEDAGYGDAFGHGLGHGFGLNVHEAPRLGPNSKDILKNGMVFTIEPGIYLPGWGGVRIEDDVLLENGKASMI